MAEKELRSNPQIHSRRRILKSIFRLGVWLGFYPMARGQGPRDIRTSPPDHSDDRSRSESPLAAAIDSPEEILYDCLILGGGLAGLTAANALAFTDPDHPTINSKERKVLVLEGQGRLGGRLLSQSPKGFPTFIELGAQYIHVDDKQDSGGRRIGLWRALERFGVATTPIHRFICGFAYSKYFSTMRRHWQLIFEIPLFWLLTFREKIISYRGKDLSIQQWLSEKGYGTKQRPIVDIFLSGPASGNPVSVSFNGFNLDRFATMEEGDYEYKLNRGWGYLVQRLRFPDLKQLYFDRSRGLKKARTLDVRYHSSIKKIEYDNNGVVVTVHERNKGRPDSQTDLVKIDENLSTSEEGTFVVRTYRARTAIVTFPIGVLRRSVGLDPSRTQDERIANSQMIFSPPLPYQKVRALKAIGAGVAAKMFIVFESRFWDAGMGLLNRLDGLSRMGRVYFVSNYGKDSENFVLGAYFGGYECQRISTWEEEKILLHICRELAEMFPDVDREKAIERRVRRHADGRYVYAYKNWAHDKWSFCNDSYLRFDPKGSGDDIYFARKVLASAKDTGALHWAGEATAYDDGNKEYAYAHPGVTHGAQASGLRAAKEVSQYLDEGKFLLLRK